MRKMSPNVFPKLHHRQNIFVVFIVYLGPSLHGACVKQIIYLESLGMRNDEQSGQLNRPPRISLDFL